MKTTDDMQPVEESNQESQPGEQDQYVNPLFLLEELRQQQDLVAALHSQCKEHEDRFERAESDHHTKVSSIHEKLELLKLENKLIIRQLQTRSIAKGASESLKTDKHKLTEKCALEQEVHRLREQVVRKEIEICTLRESIGGCHAREEELIDDKAVTSRHNKQLENEIAALKAELSQSNMVLREHKRSSVFTDPETVDSNDLARKSSNRALNVAGIVDELQQTSLHERNYESEIMRYKNEAKRLSSQCEISQHRERERETELDTLKKVLLNTKRSEIEVKIRYKQEKMLSEEKQKQFENLEVITQLTKSKLARYMYDLDQQMKESEKVKLTQEEMMGYIEKLVATVNEHNPKLLEKVTL